jgi:hypothetical protein
MIVYGETLVRLDLGVADKLQRVYWPDMALNTHPPMMLMVEPSVQQPRAQSGDQPATGSKRRAECMEDIEMEDVDEPSPSKKSKTILHVLPRSLTPARTPSSADSTPRSTLLPDATENILTKADDSTGPVDNPFALSKERFEEMSSLSTQPTDNLFALSKERYDEMSSLSAGISLLSLSVEKEKDTETSK